MSIDLGTTLTDDRMRRLDKRLQSIYSEAYRTAIEREKKAIAKLADLDIDKLKADGLTDTQIRAKQLYHKAAVERETKLTSKIAAELANAGTTAAKIVQGEMLNIYGLNLDFSAYSIDKQAGVMLDWTIYDKNQISVLLDSEQSPFTKVAYKNMGNDKIIVQRLQNILTQSVISGESQQQIIKRIREVTGQSVSQARRVAQTERTRVQSQGRAKGIDDAVNMGIEMDDEWISRRDSVVRDDHAEVSGEIVPHGKLFSNGMAYPGDPRGRPEQVIRCRCVLKPRVRNVPDSVKRYREKMAANYGFDEWRKNR